IAEVFMSQTHRHAIGHPLFFTIGHRPALLQLAVTGEGIAPDVQVEGRLNGSSLGVLCLKGPDVLQNSIDLDTPNFEDYFSVTLPKNWIQDGLTLELSAGNESRMVSSEELKIGPYTEMNLVMVNMDVLDYNSAPPIAPIFDNFLEELASAIPASVVRFGTFPETLKFQEIIANNDTEELVRLRSRSEMGDNGIFSDGYINSIAVQFLGNLHRSTNDYLSTVYFGNTLNLAPGGWGGGKNFVGFDYTDIFIHELGHALSLPHWGEGSYDNESDSEYEFLYPYGGEGNDGGGRGEAWNFIQDQYEFVSPICEDEESEHLGGERSDCMQRNNRCLGQRSTGAAPWDGYGDFSAIAIHRYLTGASVASGQVSDRGEMKDFRLNTQRGFPVVSVDNEGNRVYRRDALQPQELLFEEEIDLPGEEQTNQPVYLVYGSIHETQNQANIVYKPIPFTGTLPPIIDPTNPEIFDQLQDLEDEFFLYGTLDITLKITYEDGSVLHALNPFQSFARAPYTWGYHIWRDDICNFSLVVPGDKKLAKVELYKRPFCVRDMFDNIEGNINYAANDITAENFMEDAVYLTEYEFGAPPVLGSNTIGNRVWHDENQNGIQDEGEKGIADVSLVLWADSDGDEIPDWEGFLGVAKTDEEGYYSFDGLGPGNYLVFVWEVENWEEGQPLEGMVPTSPYVADPNTDLDFDSHGRPGNLEWGLSESAMVSGLITLTADGEPLGDGDREDDWFDYDPSGNMTVDFGFYVDGATSVDDFGLQAANMYPNPSAGLIRFETAIFENHTLSLINTNGQTVLHTTLDSNSTQLEVGSMPVGLYAAVLRDEFGNIQWTSKFVKSN
ncbi:MAG: SdrD B-like domain-containing protein, partial [Chitinophagales bacterium]